MKAADNERLLMQKRDKTELILDIFLFSTIHKRNKKCLRSYKTERTRVPHAREWKCFELQSVCLNSMFQYFLVTRLVKDKKF